MAGTGAVIEWYLARDGKQYGPLSDVEMAKLVELGHLRPDDLVWKAGFPDWQAAGAVFAQPRPAAPPPPPAPPATGRPAGAAPVAGDVREAAPELAVAAPREPQTVAAGRPRPAGHELHQPATGRPHAAAPSHASQGPGSGPGPGRGPAELRVPARDQAPPSADRERAQAKPAKPRKAAAGKKRRGGIGRLLALMVLLSLVGGGAFAAYKYRDTLQGLAKRASTIQAPAASAPALKGFTASVDALDAKLQQAQMWQVLKREFPDWYGERVKEAARLAGEGRPEAAVAKGLAEALVALRRKNADHAFASSLPRLKLIAETFRDNLVRLGKFNKIACFAFISQNEAHPIVVDMMQKPEFSAPIQAQLAAVFEAIAEGRRSPVKHLPPRKADYDEVTKLLMQKKGWKDKDLELFSDSQALAKAEPAAVCKLVTDWFDAHLEIKEDEVLTRLLVEAVRPVVGG